MGGALPHNALHSPSNDIHRSVIGFKPTAQIRGVLWVYKGCHVPLDFH